MSTKRWRLLAVVVGVQSVGTWLSNAPLFLIAHLHLAEGMSLTRAGALASTSLIGTMLTLVAWGALADRIGERRSLLLGLATGSAAGVASSFQTSPAALGLTWFLVGVGTASLNSSSGRLIVGWFPLDQRGTAMGIRQTALPLGIGLAALTEPVLAATYGLGTALLVPSLAGLMASAAVAAFVVDPPRDVAGPGSDPNVTSNPYARDRLLVRIHLASALLVIPQITVWTFIVVWLMDARGWSTAAAGGLAAATQLLGATGRIGAGWWSDRVGDRIRPIRTIALGAAATMLLLGLTESTAIAVTVMVIATVVTVADNGLAFTAVAELGGPSWAGRAMGIQNTGQYLVAAAVPPAMGAVIADHGYGLAFGAVAVFPLLALALLPVSHDRNIKFTEAVNSRTRSIVACIAALAIVLPLAWMWQRSLMPDTYSVGNTGSSDYGVNAKGKPIPAPKSPALPRGSTKPAEGAKDKGVSIATLVERSKKKAADVVVDLSAQEGTFPLAGQEMEGIVLNGRTPGPDIVVKQGELLEVRLRNNNVADGVALHWHGIDVPNAEDGVAGVTQDAVLPGKSRTYRFVAKQAGTYWYHSHQVSHEQVAGGLFGSLVVLPKASIRAKHDLTAVAHTYSGNRTLNGRAGDIHAVARPGDTVRLRVVNTDNGTLSAWSSTPFRVVAIDGYDLEGETTVKDRRLEVAAGGRADLEFKVPRKGAARVQIGAATAYVVGPRQSYPERPAQPAKVLDLLSYGSAKPGGSADMPKPNRVFDYSIGRRPGFIDGRPGYWWTINGRMWPNVPMFMVRKGDVVKFSIDNRSGESHPMHLHGHHALVTARNGKPVTGGPVWIDSIDVKDDETIDLVFRADNPGIWMGHCQNLQHAAEGLTARLVYEGYSTPYKVGGKSGNQPE